VRVCFLHILQRYASVERRGDERVPQRVRPDALGDPGAAGRAADYPRGTMTVQPPPVRSQEDRPADTLADGQIDGAGAAACFQVTGEALDVGAAGGGQADLMLLAPGRVLA
jgi:hypothetical protein